MPPPSHSIPRVIFCKSNRLSPTPRNTALTTLVWQDRGEYISSDGGYSDNQKLRQNIGTLRKGQRSTPETFEPSFSYDSRSYDPGTQSVAGGGSGIMGYQKWGPHPVIVVSFLSLTKSDVGLPEYICDRLTESMASATS